MPVPAGRVTTNERMIPLNNGYVSLILHAHLPFIRHPEYDSFFEERWLFEAISEVYIPLLDVFDTLISENTSFRLTMSITPTLLSMLSDQLLQDRYIVYVEKQLELCRNEKQRAAQQPAIVKLARMYEKNCKNALTKFKTKYSRDLVGAFRRLQDSGHLEILASAATHGFLPLIGIHEESIQAQISTGVRCYERYFGRKPKGLWLPECGYFPGVEASLMENGIEYFILETHGIRFAEPRPVFGVYAPIVTPNGLAAFGRDPESSRQVWSSHEGYPGDYDYRDYYRDIGFDLDYSYIKDYISPDGQRSATGIKYHRITGKSEEKLIYDHAKAKKKAERHAADFIMKKEQQLEQLNKYMSRQPIIVCPYDAELFGHWWYEGPHWLYSLIKGACGNQDDSYSKQAGACSEQADSPSKPATFTLTTPGDYLASHPVMQLSSPCTSSWGHAGYNDIWLNKSNDWIYKHLHKASFLMTELAERYPAAGGLLKEALNQAARELLLAQSSDWAFIMKAATLSEYAGKRTRGHIYNFNRLYTCIVEDNIDEGWLQKLMQQDNIFPDIDYSVYSKRTVNAENQDYTIPKILK